MEKPNDIPAHEVPKPQAENPGYDDFIKNMPLNRILDPEAFEEWIMKGRNDE